LYACRACPAYRDTLDTLDTPVATVVMLVTSIVLLALGFFGFRPHVVLFCSMGLTFRPSPLGQPRIVLFDIRANLATHDTHDTPVSMAIIQRAGVACVQFTLFCTRGHSPSFRWHRHHIS